MSVYSRNPHTCEAARGGRSIRRSPSISAAALPRIAGYCAREAEAFILKSMGRETWFPDSRLQAANSSSGKFIRRSLYTPSLFSRPLLFRSCARARSRACRSLGDRTVGRTCAVYAREERGDTLENRSLALGRAMLCWGCTLNIAWIW